MYSELVSKVLWDREVLISVCVKRVQAEKSQGALWDGILLEFDPMRGQIVSKSLHAKVSTRLPIIVPPRSEGAVSTCQTKRSAALQARTSNVTKLQSQQMSKINLLLVPEKCCFWFAWLSCPICQISLLLIQLQSLCEMDVFTVQSESRTRTNSHLRQLIAHIV